MDLNEIVRRAAKDLSALRVKWALVGGLAVSARAKPRFTNDVDFVVVVEDDAAAQALIMDLRARGYELHMVLERKSSDALATVRLGSPDRLDGKRILVDLLLSACGIESEIVAAASTLDVGPGLDVPVAQLGHLIAMKVLSRHRTKRPQDEVDLAELLRVAPAAEIRRARTAVALIERRGFSGGKKLRQGLESAIARYRV